MRTDRDKQRQTARTREGRDGKGIIKGKSAGRFFQEGRVSTIPIGLLGEVPAWKNRNVRTAAYWIIYPGERNRKAKEKGHVKEACAPGAAAFRICRTAAAG